MCRNTFNNSQAFIPRIDPLTLDLDNDGLETVSTSTSKPILFDHNGDGIKTGTGWVRPDDGFLVFDRNGNGMIDNGAELFGDSTALYSGGKAADGFAALAQEDSNVDGKVDSHDAHWSQLKVWRDLDQDGISQSGELFSTEQAGIASFNVAKKENSQVLANGNQIADLGSFTRTSGVGATLGEVGQMADINLAEDTFYRQFKDKVPLAEGVAALPDVHGSGKVRDLRGAASDSLELNNLLTQFSQATTRQEQKALLGQLLEAWADTSGMAKSMEERAAGKYAVSFQSIGSQLRSNSASDAWLGVVDAWERKMHVLEAFNGRYFFRLPNETDVGNAALQGLTVVPVAGTAVGGMAQINVDLSQGQTALLEQSYDALLQSVYRALYMQTRFRSLLGDVELVFGETGVSMDFSAVEEHFKSAVTADAVNGLGDLIDFNRGLIGTVPASNWKGPVMLAQYMSTIPVTADMLKMYLQSGIRVVGQVVASSSGSTAYDIILAEAADSAIHANSGNDTLVGRAGGDQLYGQDGNDLLFGGIGNDSLNGGTGNDTYVLAQGDGADTISDYDTTVDNIDVVQFTNVLSTEVTSTERKGNDLVLKYAEADELTVKGYFDPNYAGYRIERFSFSDDVNWDDAAIKAQVMTIGSAGFDCIFGYDDGANRIYALGGDDYLFGGSNDDFIDGGTGDDIMYGRGGNDMLVGGAGVDTLNGDEGNDLLLGGNGNDLLYGGIGNDTYVFARGDGVDMIDDYDTTAGNTDVVQFTDVVSTEVTSVERKGNELVMKYGATDQLTVKDYFNVNYPGSRIERFSFSDGVNWDDKAIKAQVITTGSMGYDYITGYDDGTNRIYGLDGNDYLSGGAKDDFIDGGTGNDTLNGQAGHDTLVGGVGDDRLNGEEGNDILVGGTGNDSLYGEKGNDTYVFAKGDGVDMIDDYDTTAGNIDVVQFTDEASTELTSVERKGNDLVLKYAETDQVTVTDYFNPSYPGSLIERFDFSDGVSWDNAAIKSRVVTNGTTFADYLAGYEGGSNHIYGLDGDDYLFGGGKDDFLEGGAGNDYLQGYAGDDTLFGGDGNDMIYGGDGNDVIDGGAGSDLLYGGDGADVIRFGKGYGADHFNSANTAAFRLDTVELFDLEADEVSLIRSGDALKVSANGSDDRLTIDYFFGGGTVTTIDNLRFADGTVWDDAAIKARAFTSGTMFDDYIVGYSDCANRIYGLGGDDRLYGGTMANFIDGGAGNDYLQGDAGNDILQGASGLDTLADTTGNNLFHGGADNDVLYGGSSNEFYLGGAGNDSITTGLGYDLIAFNRGDGQDTVAASTGRDNTLSLGGGIAYGDLSLSRSANNLVLTTGANESLTFKDWYASPDNHSVANLQMVVEGSGDYDAASSDGLLNQKIAQFDFDAMVSRFDAAQTASPGLSNWALSSALLDFHLASSDTASIGGDLAYQYGRYGDLSGMSVNAAQSLLAGAQFGAGSQALRSGATQNDLSPRLM